VINLPRQGVEDVFVSYSSPARLRNAPRLGFSLFMAGYQSITLDYFRARTMVMRIRL
jgi:hypothetical protein